MVLSIEPFSRTPSVLGGSNDSPPTTKLKTRLPLYPHTGGVTPTLNGARHSSHEVRKEHLVRGISDTGAPRLKTEDSSSPKRGQKHQLFLRWYLCPPFVRWAVLVWTRQLLQYKAKEAQLPVSLPCLTSRRSHSTLAHRQHSRTRTSGTAARGTLSSFLGGGRGRGRTTKARTCTGRYKRRKTIPEGRGHVHARRQAAGVASTSADESMTVTRTTTTVTTTMTATTTCTAADRQGGGQPWQWRVSMCRPRAFHRRLTVVLPHRTTPQKNASAVVGAQTKQNPEVSHFLEGWGLYYSVFLRVTRPPHPHQKNFPQEKNEMYQRSI